MCATIETTFSPKNYVQVQLLIWGESVVLAVSKYRRKRTCSKFTPRFIQTAFAKVNIEEICWMCLFLQYLFTATPKQLRHTSRELAEFKKIKINLFTLIVHNCEF